jgi:hypothetical protein
MTKRPQIKLYQYIELRLKMDLLLFEKYDFGFRTDFIDFQNRLFTKTKSPLMPQLRYNLISAIMRNLND